MRVNFKDAIKEFVALIFDSLNLQLWQEYIILNRQVCDDFILEDAIKEVLKLILTAPTLTYNLGKNISSLRDMV